MLREKFNNIELIYETGLVLEIKLINENHRKIEELIGKLWGFKKPRFYKIYVVKSFLKLVYLITPWSSKIFLLVFLPAWIYEIKRNWNVAGGVITSQKVPIMALKPIKQFANKGLMKKIYCNETDDKERFKDIFCHELTHVFSMHLQLPMWINEGIAMVTVEKFTGMQKVRYETLNMLNSNNNFKVINYTDLHKKDTNSTLYTYIQGYWTILYIERKYPGFIKELVENNVALSKSSIGKKIGINEDNDNFFIDLNKIIFNYFK